jgi:ABC-2 type transport system ATP-binding protein
VTFTLEKGEILGFLGPNGAGKTSTMQMICGNLAPTSGQITINGIDLLDQPKEAKRALGYLPEVPPLYRELTVDEFLAYCARLHGLPRDSQARARDQAKERCGLEEVGSRLIGNLSKGYQQRVGIAQAILHTPAVIVLDEPTVGLDPIQIREIRELIAELGKEHGIILSTHILSEVKESCTHVQIIHQGQLVLKDTIAGLDQQMRGSSLRLTTREAVDAERVRGLPGVDSAEMLEPNVWRIFHDRNTNPAEQVAQLVVNSGCGLLEMTPEKRSLEQVFIEMTRHNAPDGEENAT